MGSSSRRGRKYRGRVRSTWPEPSRGRVWWSYGRRVYPPITRVFRDATGGGVARKTYAPGGAAGTDVPMDEGSGVGAGLGKGGASATPSPGCHSNNVRYLCTRSTN